MNAKALVEDGYWAYNGGCELSNQSKSWFCPCTHSARMPPCGSLFAALIIEGFSSKAGRGFRVSMDFDHRL